MKGQCIPRIKSHSYSKNRSSSSSPMTLLERFREAVLRLMMLSALSKASGDQGGSGGSSGGDRGQAQTQPHRSYRLNDPHHSEAVADCIEFIKQKSVVVQNRHSIASSSGESAVDQVVMPVYCNT